MHWLIHRTVAVVLGSAMLAALAGSARAQTVAQTAHAERRVRIVDVGFRPLVSMPDALGVSAEVHPFGGNLALEGGFGMSPVVAFTWTAAVKYRFVVYTTDQVQLSVGPGVGSHWLFEPGSPIDQQLLSAFATLEAVWWKWSDGRIGFRVAMDAGVMHPIYDAPEGSNLGTTPVFNGSIGLAFRLGR